jgi:hypothetical protein
MSALELRPLTLGELLDRAFALYRRNFQLFAGIMLIPSSVLLPMQFLLLRSQGMPFPWARPSQPPKFPPYLFGIFFVYWIVYTVAQAATTYAVADTYLGRRSTIAEAYRKIRGHFWRVIGISLNVAIRIAGMVFLLVVLMAVGAGILVAVLTRGTAASKPGPLAILIGFGFVLCVFAAVVWFAMRYCGALPALLIEDITGRAAIRRSVQLSQGRRGQIFVAMLLASIILYSVSFLFQGPFYVGIAVAGIQGHLPIWILAGMSVASLIGGAIAGPLVMIILVLCYYDLRIRKEGFDLQHMMTSLPQTEAAGSPAVL